MHITSKRIIKKREDFLWADGRYVQFTQLTMLFTVDGKKHVCNALFNEEDMDKDNEPTEEATLRLSRSCWERLGSHLERKVTQP